MSLRTAHVLRAVPAAVVRLGAICVGLCWTTLLPAADRADEFLEGLRNRGWHDVALEYLETADQDPLATQEFLDRVDYQRAATLAALARQTIRESERLDLSRQAIELFQSYAAAHRKSPEYFDALSQAGSLLSEQALGKLAKADRLPAGTASQHDALQVEARETFDSASEVVEQLLAACQQELAAGDELEPEIQQRLIVKQAQARYLVANLLFDKANTYAAGSQEYNQTLDAAAEAFAQLHQQYRDKLVGFYGRLYEGRCYQATGKWDEALDCYADLVDQPISAPDFRRIIARAFRYRAECHLAANHADNAISECQDWLSEARGDDLKQPEWLAVAYRLAEAYEKKAVDATASQAGKLRTEARQLFREVAAQPGEFQADARATLASGHVADVAPRNVKSFSEAFTAGKEAIERMNSTKLAARLAEENNPESVADLRRQASQNQTDAKRLLVTALRLSDDDSKQEDVLAARHYLCWIYWDEGRTSEAAVLGEFLARRYPQSNVAASAAKVALAAWEKLYLEAKQAGDDGRYEAENLSSLAELITQHWPESPEASTAVSMLMQVALGDNRLTDAEQLLEKLPETSRAAAELNLGGALWSRYLQLSGQSPDEAAPAAAKLKQRAEQLLSSGYTKVFQATAPTAPVATGVLYYVQSLLAQGQFEQAIAVLENPTIGPLAVVERGSLDVQPAFVLEAYKAALRAYLSIDPPQREKVQQVMTALEEAIGAEEDAQEQLTRVYLGLGLELERQINQLADSGESAQAQSLAAALEDLLQRITSRGGSGDWKVRNWIAQTQLQLGAGLRGEAAERHLTRAEEVYRAMLSDAEKDAGYAPNKLAVLGVRKKLGDCLQAQEKFDEALNQYVSILREKPNMLDLQREAALVLQEWGRAQKKSDKLEQAIRGAVPQADKKNLVWGWLRLATIANRAQQAASRAGNGDTDRQKVQKYQDAFFEARFHVAQARLQAAQIATGAERTRQLDAARKNVQSMQRLYPDLGGPKWQQAFEQLVAQIEAASTT